jgi:hypothetical protein
MSGDVVRDFLPGDNIEMAVELATRGNLKIITAVFIKEGSQEAGPQGRLALSSHNITVRKRKDDRLSHAILTRDTEWSTKILPEGDYWLDSIRGETSLGKPVSIGYNGRICVRLRPEPEEENLSITNLSFRD